MRFMLSCLLLFVMGVSSAFAITAQDVKLQLEARDKKALASADALTKAEPKNAEAWILLTRARLQANQAEAAIDSAQKAVKLAPNNSQAHFILGNAYGSRIGQVNMLSQASMSSKIRDAFEKAVALDPNNLDAREGLVQFYLQAPSMFGGSVDKANMQANEIAKRDVVRGHLVRAQVFMSQKNNAAAMKSYEAAYAAKPSDKNIRMAVGIGYQMTERWSDAFKLFRTWVSQDEKAGVAWYQLGRTSAMSGLQIEEGIAALQKYLHMPHAANEPQNKNAYHRLGQLYAKAGKTLEAKAALQAALKLDPKFADAKTELGKLK
ncbi:MAG: tetratricopeptide repeat protein [Arenimonas sp.]